MSKKMVVFVLALVFGSFYFARIGGTAVRENVLELHAQSAPEVIQLAPCQKLVNANRETLPGNGIVISVMTRALETGESLQTYNVNLYSNGKPLPNPTLIREVGSKNCPTAVSVTQITTGDNSPAISNANGNVVIINGKQQKSK